MSTPFTLSFCLSFLRYPVCGVKIPQFLIQRVFFRTGSLSLCSSHGSLFSQSLGFLKLRVPHTLLSPHIFCLLRPPLPLPALSVSSGFILSQLLLYFLHFTLPPLLISLWHRASYSSGWSWTHYTVEDDPELLDSSTSTSQVLGLPGYATIPILCSAGD